MSDMKLTPNGLILPESTRGVEINESTVWVVWKCLRRVYDPNATPRDALNLISYIIKEAKEYGYGQPGDRAGDMMKTKDNFKRKPEEGIW